MKNIPSEHISFEENVDYYELYPDEYYGKWRFITTKTIKIPFAHTFTGPNEEIQFLSGDKVWVTMRKNILTICKDYAWNGCSPKRGFGIWWGTPDFQGTRLASLVHDSLRQFEMTSHSPFTREEQDNIFLSILRQKKFKLRLLYFLGVRFGSQIIPYKNFDLKSRLISLNTFE